MGVAASAAPHRPFLNLDGLHRSLFTHRDDPGCILNHLNCNINLAGCNHDCLS